MGDPVSRLLVPMKSLHMSARQPCSADMHNYKFINMISAFAADPPKKCAHIGSAAMSADRHKIVHLCNIINAASPFAADPASAFASASSLVHSLPRLL